MVTTLLEIKNIYLKKVKINNLVYLEYLGKLPAIYLWRCLEMI